MGNIVYFNNMKNAGRFNGFIWSICGNDLHVYRDDEEVPEDSLIYQQIKNRLNFRKAS
ncbi:MAG: hypothetical protein IJ065_08770 [Eubacterium sp.]|nr:hypothetical protein [Eubacterium sp.]